MMKTRPLSCSIPSRWHHASPLAQCAPCSLFTGEHWLKSKTFSKQREFGCDLNVKNCIRFEFVFCQFFFFYQVWFVFISLPRGTRSTFGSLVPVVSPGRERNMSVITVTLLVEDHLGAKVIALNK